MWLESSLALTCPGRGHFDPHRLSVSVDFALEAHSREQPSDGGRALTDANAAVDETHRYHFVAVGEFLGERRRRRRRRGGRGGGGGRGREEEGGERGEEGGGGEEEEEGGRRKGGRGEVEVGEEGGRRGRRGGGGGRRSGRRNRRGGGGRGRGEEVYNYFTGSGHGIGNLRGLSLIQSSRVLGGRCLTG